ncbi:unnamed protein product [Dicrocoelium dendriticum]|nr:unnamed protein product [Dicrocoelium dendriticum]
MGPVEPCCALKGCSHASFKPPERRNWNRVPYRWGYSRPPVQSDFRRPRPPPPRRGNFPPIHGSRNLQGLFRLLADFEDKHACAVCTFAFCPARGAPVSLFTGRTCGHIVPPRGPLDFGWDPVFQPIGFEMTYAEMEKETKNSISHRHKALMMVKRHFEEIM